MQHLRSRRTIFTILTVLVLVIIGGVLFIELNTSAAATFTDEILRPLIGDARVIALEKLFFNTTDTINRLKYKVSTPQDPFLHPSGTPIPASAANSSNLDLSVVQTAALMPIMGEGEWNDIPLDLFPGKVVVADTFIRPDPARSYAFVTLVQMDMSKLRLWSVAGTKEPGGQVGKPGPGIIPPDIQRAGRLVAAFDGGFQYRDGQYGMIVGDTTYLPLKNDLATLVGHADGRIEIVDYTGQSLGNDVIFVRQNCPMLVEHGVVESKDDVNRALWGRTITSDIYTWRSGIGITAKGNLLFAVGNALVPSTLATALKAAGAVDAMQLDINPNWVRFNVFDHYSSAGYSSAPIMQGIRDGSQSYLHGYNKDFFYLTAN
ncbi:MAG TPA: phosphodiester glycosidase family protein [Candidatus Paceibacterota bacterium]|nr:phosphodiester glycosidase family protein [Candidatus Paceibacterota bacterium]